MASRLPSHVQYRNATYFGGLQSYQRNGHGLLVLDNSQILMGQWKKNLLNGKYIYIGDGLRAFGSMQNNRLDGYNILHTYPEVGKPGTIERTIYGMFREDKLYGKVIIIENNTVLVSHFANNELKQVISKTTVRDREIYEVLAQHFPKNMYTLEQFLISFMKEATVATATEQDQVPRYQPLMLNIDDERFFGYEECFNKGKRYGFILKQNKVISVGEHFNNLLEGIGRFYGEQCIEDGIFKQGYLKGIGIKYYFQGNRYTIGEHDGKSSLQKGFGFPIREVCEIRKQFHLRSIYFYNDIIMLGISSHILALIATITVQNRPRRSESPKFTEEYRPRSPLKQNLYKYEADQDFIEEPSPIKNKFNQYKPVDHRANKYFTLDEEEEEYDKKRQKEKLNYRQSRNNERQKDKQTASRFTNALHSEQYRQDGNSGARTQGERRDRSTSKTNGKSGVKDTRQFVRQLEQQQKRKRLDLDRIYKQAGLYRRK